MTYKDKAIVEFFKKGYSIDNQGKIKSPRNNELNGVINRGYHFFKIRIDSKVIATKIHRIQAYKKFGNKIFEKGIQVRHLNDNGLDNSWDNIEIGNQSENMMDRKPELRLKVAINASRKKQDSIRSHEERCSIYEDLIKGLSYSEIMKKHSINSKGTLSFMKNKSQEFKDYKNKYEF